MGAMLCAVQVAAYSAALSQEQRALVGQKFADGSIPVIIATTAFGMGVNKKDVRLVINWGPPGSLSMYMQMIGRAGRDLCPARCMLFWSPSGISSRKFMMRQDAARCAAAIVPSECSPADAHTSAAAQSDVADVHTRLPSLSLQKVNGSNFCWRKGFRCRFGCLRCLFTLCCQISRIKFMHLRPSERYCTQG
jgi:superfamily II DNA helicase RecQ